MGTSAIRQSRLRWWEAILLLTGLLLFAGQAFFSSPRKSAAFDEQYHVSAGYAYLKTGDFRMSLSHPPLVDALTAVPLLFRHDVNLPLDHVSWAANDYFHFADVFLWQSQADPQSIVEWARWPVMAVGVALVAVLFWWARQMAGVWAGWIALTLAVFDPNLIANARLVTTDLGVTCFLLLTIWRLWHWLVRPSPLNLLLCAFFAALTMAAKFNGIIVWPMMVGIAVIWRWEMADGKSQARFLLSRFLMMGVAAYLVLWAIYRFDVTPFPGTAVPLPASFYPYSLWQTFQAIESEAKAAFLLGETSRGGWWYYFPVTLAVKTSLPLLILTGIGAVIALKHEGWRKTAVLWLPIVLFLALAMAGNITIGYRHILPVAPFLIMLASYSGNWVITKTNYPITQLLITLLLLWQAVGTLRLYPHQEAFFNELVGGPIGGARVLSDSNLDWGQDLMALREVMANLGIETVNLGYFGTAVPEQYGISYQPLPGYLRFTAGAEIDTFNPYTPPPGWYAISQTSLHMGLVLQNNDLYAYFQEQTPIARAGYSINLYRVDYPEDVPVDQVVVTGTAVSDLSLSELERLSVTGDRLSPDNSPITGQGLPVPGNGRRLITKWTANEATTIIPFTEPWAPPPDFQPVGVNFSDVMTLAGYALPAPASGPGEPVPLTLFWQRGAAPVPSPLPATSAPLAAFVHLSGADPSQIVAQVDGWDTAVSTLEPGDIIVQRLVLTPPADMPPGDYFLRVGLYSPQTGQRFPLADGTADFVTLTLRE
ncbi:MAG TPA: hypothetical protein PLD25_01235 [Chloroflexota bacterium]|nr:hypothetical protein [Chloroflexota bacterium]